MRYVRHNLVFRLQRTLGEELLAEINDRFHDILIAGQFTLGGPLPEEREESEVAALPRLIFRFNRRDCGRLRQLIDFINQAASSPTKITAGG